MGNLDIIFVFGQVVLVIMALFAAVTVAGGELRAGNPLVSISVWLTPVPLGAGAVLLWGL